MIKKIYNVVLQSVIGNGATTSSETFFYDWTQIPDVPYFFSFSFVSALTATLVTTVVAPSLYVDLSQSYNQIALPQSGVNTPIRGQFLGNLKYMGGTAGANSLYAEVNTNPLTFLNGRPSSNNFTVEIHGTQTADFNPPCGAYCLILSFQEC